MCVRYSVIIPIYNAEKTLCRCVDSLLAQGREDVEILLVNDGSTDGTDRICMEYKARINHPGGQMTHVLYFKQENRGVSSARNVGLRNAKGRYVLFVDSDDYVASDLFDKLDELLYGGIDLLCLSTCLYHDEMQKYEYAGTRCIWMGSAGEGSSDSWTDFYRLLTGYMRNGALQTSSAKVFKLELIQRYSITFPEYLRIAEDAVFLFAYLLHIRSFRLDNYVAYYACTENPDSLSRGRREYLPEQLLRSSRDRLALLEASDLADADRQVLRDGVSWIYYRAVYSCAMELLKFDFSGRERRKQLRVICEEYRKKAPAPGNLKGRLIAFPVKWKLAGLIDLAARVRTRLRSENHRR